MLDSHFRPLLEARVGWLLSLYQKLGLTPNQLTLLGLCGALLSAVLVYFQFYLTALCFWWLGRLFDGTDGIYARFLNRSSAFGAYFDILADMLAYSLIIVAFAMTHPSLLHLWLAILVGYVLCITSALAFGDMQNKVSENVFARDNRGLKLANGLAEGGETGIAYTLFFLFPTYLSELATAWLCILVVTVGARTVLAYKIDGTHSG